MRSLFPKIGKWVAFIRFATCETHDMIFVNFTEFETGYKSFPDTTVIPTWLKRMRSIIPIIKISLHCYLCGVRRPHTEIHTPDIIYLQRMRSELLVQAIMSSVLEISDVFIRQQRIIPDRLCSIYKMRGGIV